MGGVGEVPHSHLQPVPVNSCPLGLPSSGREHEVKREAQTAAVGAHVAREVTHTCPDGMSRDSREQRREPPDSLFP